MREERPSKLLYDGPAGLRRKLKAFGSGGVKGHERFKANLRSKMQPDRDGARHAYRYDRLSAELRENHKPVGKHQVANLIQAKHPYRGSYLHHPPQLPQRNQDRPFAPSRHADSQDAITCE